MSQVEILSHGRRDVDLVRVEVAQDPAHESGQDLGGDAVAVVCPDVGGVDAGPVVSGEEGVLGVKGARKEAVDLVDHRGARARACQEVRGQVVVVALAWEADGGDLQDRFAVEDGRAVAVRGAADVEQAGDSAWVVVGEAVGAMETVVASHGVGQTVHASAESGHWDGQRVDLVADLGGEFEKSQGWRRRGRDGHGFCMGVWHCAKVRNCE